MSGRLLPWMIRKCTGGQVLSLVFLAFLVGLYVSILQTQKVVRSTINSSDCECSRISEIKETKEIVKLAMTIKPIGRLGNLLGEYATLYSLARLNGYRAVLLPGMDKLRTYFNLSIPTLNQTTGNVIPWENHGLNDWMEPEYKQFNGTFVKLTGYPCSWTFYHNVRQEILREFTFLPSIVKDVQEFLHTAKSSRTVKATYIGVHVRRGDYVTLMRQLYDGVLADNNYLAAAMDEYRKRYANTLFIVSSDDYSWCRRNFDMSHNDVIFAWNTSSSDPGRDMALLSHCNHSIMTIGTFGYWASYLAGGDVIYLSNFTRPKSVFNKVFRPSAAFLPHWKGIPADLNSTGWL